MKKIVSNSKHFNVKLWPNSFDVVCVFGRFCLCNSIQGTKFSFDISDIILLNFVLHKTTNERDSLKQSDAIEFLLDFKFSGADAGV